MKSKLLIALVALALSAGSTLFAQDATGTWQGTMKTPARDMRLVFKITRDAANGPLQGQAFNLDQGGQPIPIASVKQNGPALEIKIDAIGGTFAGVLNADSSILNGALTLAQGPVQLALTRATPQTAWTIPEPPPPPKPMDAAADPGFEVATIKPGAPGRTGRGLGIRGSQVTVTNYTVNHIITFAYNIHDRQILAGPAWMDSERFDITGKLDIAGQPNVTQVRNVMKKLLADRFQLKFHNEKRELSVYAITKLPNTAPKITPSAAAAGSLPDARFARPGLLPARNASMAELASVMQNSVLDRPVIDQTGIEGRFDFTLDWMPDEFQFLNGGARPTIPDNGKPDIYRAFQEQLGLKIESTKAPANVMVIEKVEKPSEN